MKPWLLLPPKLSYKLAPIALNLYGRIKQYQTLTWSPKTWRGLEFTNPLGVAGGVDKNLEDFKSWWTLGPGFIEVGTITPNAQHGNPGSVIDRNKKLLAVWNKLGFPSKGADYAKQQLQGLYKPHFTPLFVNIGKNRETPNNKAHEDYITCMETLKENADAFVINISSPNTSGLRELLQPENLKAFLQPIVDANNNETPLLLKLSPDISEQQLKQILDTSLELNIDGWILTNTTLERSEKVDFPQEGGVSGLPLAEKSKQLLKQAVQHLGPQREGKLIVSTGGVMTANDVFERLELGADLVQVYSALIFNGPFFFRNVADKAATKI